MSFVISVVKIEVVSPEAGGELLQAFPNFTGTVRVVDGQALLSAREPLVVEPEASPEEKHQAAADSARQLGSAGLAGYEVISEDGELLEAGELREIQ